MGSADFRNRIENELWQAKSPRLQTRQRAEDDLKMIEYEEEMDR